MSKKSISRVKDKVKSPISKLKGRKTADKSDQAKLPYISNESIAEHREEVLRGARKYIYPLQHSKHRIVWLSVSIFLITLISFIIYSMLSLYKFSSASTFTYRVTQIVPFPVARVEGRFVSYENYLFELRRLIHYYENKSGVNFATDEGQKQLEELRRSTMDKIINDAYVKILAERDHIAVSDNELDLEMDAVAKQGRLGTNDQTLEDVLRDHWGWSIKDFRRSFKQQILARKVISKLDDSAHQKATTALNELRSGADFGEVVNKYSDDEATKSNGGDYGFELTKSSKDVPATVTGAVFSQSAGSFSDIIDTGYSLEIIKTISIENDKAKAAHIQINLKDISEYTEPLKKDSPPKVYVKI